MLESQRHHFRIPEEVSYLNCAYMSPIPSRVAAAGMAGMETKYQPHRILPIDFFTGVRQLKQTFAQLIQTPAYQRIAIIPSVSYGMATVAANVDISKGGEILLADEQFPSNYYCWERLVKEQGATIRVVEPPSESRDRGKNWNQKILNGINSNTALVALSHVHWADGTRFDLETIRQRTREVDALLVLDGTQSIGALPFEVDHFQPDVLIAGGYKWLFGPYGLGVAYYGEYFDNGTPIEENWINRKDSEDFQNLVLYQSEYQPGAGRYSVGEQSNFILTPMLTAAIQQILEWGVANIQDYCRRLNTPYLEELSAMGCWIEDDQWRGAHLLGVRIDPAQFDVTVLREALAQRKVIVSFRGNALRISTNVFNNKVDFERLLDCFKAARK